MKLPSTGPKPFNNEVASLLHAFSEIYNPRSFAPWITLNIYTELLSIL